jgi:hypothetical protein
LLITVDRWSEVEMQPLLPGLRHQWRTNPHVIFGPPCGERIAVSWRWSQTNGQAGASLQEYPTSCEPSHATAPMNPQSAKVR